MPVEGRIQVYGTGSDYERDEARLWVDYEAYQREVAWNEQPTRQILENPPCIPVVEPYENTLGELGSTQGIIDQIDNQSVYQPLTLERLEEVTRQVFSENRYINAFDPHAIDEPYTGRTYTIRINPEMYPWTAEQTRMFFDNQGIVFTEDKEEIKQKENDNIKILAHTSRFPSDMYSDILF